MQIGEIVVGAGRAIERHQIGLQLDQVAGDEARGKAEVAERLDQQPARIAAGAFLVAKGFLGRVDPGFEPDDVAYGALDTGIEGNEKIDGVLRPAVNVGEEGRQQWTGRFGLHVDRQVAAQILRIGDGGGGRRFLDKEVERIVDRHVGDEVDFDLELGDRLGKHEAGEVIAVGVLLQVDEVLGRRHPQRMTEHLGLGTRCRLQADDLRLQHDGPVIFVMRQVIDGGFDRHAPALSFHSTTDDFPLRP